MSLLSASATKNRFHPSIWSFLARGNSEEALLKSSKQKKIEVMGGLVCRGRQQFHFHPFSPKKQASDWLAPQEANVNNNNSLEAPIRGLLFGGKLEERNCHHPAPHQTSNHTQLVQRKSRMVLYSKASSNGTVTRVGRGSENVKLFA